MAIMIIATNGDVYQWMYCLHQSVCVYVCLQVCVCLCRSAFCCPRLMSWLRR